MTRSVTLFKKSRIAISKAVLINRSGWSGLSSFDSLAPAQLKPSSAINWLIVLNFTSKSMPTYDKANTVFSPDGQLFQVQYAFEAVNRGTATVCIKGTDCIVIAVEKNQVSKL